MITLFDNGISRVPERQAQDAGKREGPLAYLQCSEQYSKIVRCKWYEEWFAEYPANDKASLKGRLKSKDFKNFMDALFELEVHRLLRRLNCEVQVNPPIDGKTPDFLAVKGTDRCYVEATVRNSTEAFAAEAKTNKQFVKFLEHKLSSLLQNSGLNTITLGSSRIPDWGDEWQQFAELLQKMIETCGQQRNGQHISVKEWLYNRRLFADSGILKIIGMRISKRYGSEQELVQWKPSESWTPSPHFMELINFRFSGAGSPIDLYYARRNRRYPLISIPQGFVMSYAPLYRAVKAKASKYAHLDLKGAPLLVAVNNMAMDQDSDQYEESLYTDGPGNAGKTFRPKLARINGVVVVENGTIENEQGARVKLFRNGSLPLPGWLSFMAEGYVSFGSLLGIGNPGRLGSWQPPMKRS